MATVEREPAAVANESLDVLGEMPAGLAEAFGSSNGPEEPSEDLLSLLPDAQEVPEIALSWRELLVSLPIAAIGLVVNTHGFTHGRPGLAKACVPCMAGGHRWSAAPNLDRRVITLICEFNAANRQVIDIEINQITSKMATATQSLKFAEKWLEVAKLGDQVSLEANRDVIIRMEARREHFAGQIEALELQRKRLLEAANGDREITYEFPLDLDEEPYHA